MEKYSLKLDIITYTGLADRDIDLGQGWPEIFTLGVTSDPATKFKR